MTIGIGVSGPEAGLAVLRGLEAVEAVAWGMLGGFVSLAVITRDGRLLRAGTQRGGACALHFDEPHGVCVERGGAIPGRAPLPVPLDYALAERAVLISSGPDRAEPLSQFAPGEAAVGLVSGHRLPNMPGGPGARLAINLECLERMRGGADPAAAVAGTLGAWPGADAGLIAIGRDGRVGIGNSALVERRSDAGHCLMERDGLRIAVLHNSVFPVAGLGALAAGAAFEAVRPADAGDFTIRLEAGLTIRVGASALVEVDAQRRVIGLQVSNPGWSSPHWQGAAAMRDTPVVDQDGRTLGVLVTEAYCMASGGVLERCNGAAAEQLLVRGPG
jgi:hypothetical protein